MTTNNGQKNSSTSNTNSNGVNYKWVLLPPLMILWWGASALNSVAAKRAAKANPFCIVILSAASNWLGLVLFLLWKWWQPPPKQKLFTNGLRELWDMRGLSAAHAIGLFASYQGLVQGRVSLVQAVKAVEPLIAMTMSALIYKQFPTNSRVVYAAGTVVAGTIAVLVEDTSFAWAAVLWTLASSLATQGRNQLMKQRQNKNEQHCPADQHDSPLPKSPAMVGLLMFISTSAAAFLINLLMVATAAFTSWKNNHEGILHGIPLPTHDIFLAGITHFAYNMASFAVLSLVEMPATHSLANTAKRAVVIGFAAKVLQEPLSTKAEFGLMLVIAGSAGYVYFSKVAPNNKAAASTAADARTRYGQVLKRNVLIIIFLSTFLQFMIVPMLINRSNANGTVQWNNEVDSYNNSAGTSSWNKESDESAEATSGALTSEDVSESATKMQEAPKSACLYDTVYACLQWKGHIEQEERFTFAELHEGMDHCVRHWVAAHSKNPPGTGSSYAFFSSGRGKLKDRLDWSLYRSNSTALVRDSLYKMDCGESVEMTPPSWGNELPTASRNLVKGGVFLPPWYGMESTEQPMEGGFQLPLGPVRRTTTKLNLTAGMDVNVYSKVPNLGDCYNNYLVPMLSGRNYTIRRPGSKSKTGYPYVCVVGSVMKPDCEIVWGTGIISEGSHINFQNPKAEVFATRGPKTLSQTVKGHKGRKVQFGDPGLLLPLLLPMPEPEHAVDVCVIPHYIDHTQSSFKDLQRKLKTSNNTVDGLSVRILNIEVCSLTGYVQKLSGCKRVLSSSLHGLIFSLAYGIPGARLLLSDDLIGGHFKFWDFYEGIGHPELYLHEPVRSGSEIPIRKMWEKLESSVVPPLNVEDLWNVNPFHAENIGIGREEHLGYVRSYFEKHQEYYPHKPYSEVPHHEVKAKPKPKATPVKAKTKAKATPAAKQLQKRQVQEPKATPLKAKPKAKATPAAKQLKKRQVQEPKATPLKAKPKAKATPAAKKTGT